MTVHNLFEDCDDVVEKSSFVEQLNNVQEEAIAEIQRKGRLLNFLMNRIEQRWADKCHARFRIGVIRSREQVSSMQLARLKWWVSYPATAPESPDGPIIEREVRFADENGLVGKIGFRRMVWWASELEIDMAYILDKELLAARQRLNVVNHVALSMRRFRRSVAKTRGERLEN